MGRKTQVNVEQLIKALLQVRSRFCLQPDALSHLALFNADLYSGFVTHSSWILSQYQSDVNVLGQNVRKACKALRKKSPYRNVGSVDLQQKIRTAVFIMRERLRQGKEADDSSTRITIDPVSLNYFNQQLSTRYVQQSASGGSTATTGRKRRRIAIVGRKSDTVAFVSSSGSSQAGRRKRRRMDAAGSDNVGGSGRVVVGRGFRGPGAAVHGSSSRPRSVPYLVPMMPTERYSDIGGCEDILKDIQELIHYPFEHPEVFEELKIEPVHGVLLHGPPGCGKTFLARAIAGELDVAYFHVPGPSIARGQTGESEARLRSLFESAVEMAPSLVFIDDIDTVGGKSEGSSRGMDRRVVAQLGECLDGLKLSSCDGQMVMVLAATNRPDRIEPSLRRGGRFTREIEFGVPNETARRRMLDVIVGRKKIAPNVNLETLAKVTPGYVGADIEALATEAGTVALKRIFRDRMLGNDEEEDDVVVEEEEEQEGEEVGNSNSSSKNKTKKKRKKKKKERGAEEQQEQKQELQDQSVVTPFGSDVLDGCSISMDDFETALTRVKACMKREGFSTVPDVTWDDIGALEDIRERMESLIVKQIQLAEQFDRLGARQSFGVILFGPPGCGKTLVAKAVANSTHANFLAVNGPELLNKFVGETERAVRTVFSRARSSAPCVVFFDELDALCPTRGSSSVNKVTDRVVNQILTEMDGIGKRKDVYVIAATNRIDIIDRAVLRPGRLGTVLFVPLPNANARLKILQTHVRGTPMAADVDLRQYAKACVNFSGADLRQVVYEAKLACLDEATKTSGVGGGAVQAAPRAAAEGTDDMQGQLDLVVTHAHFLVALRRVVPSVLEHDRVRYERLAAEFCAK